MNQTILQQKQALVEEISKKIGNAGSTVVVEYRGLTVAEVTELRRALRAEGCEMIVYKNSMTQRAAEQLGYHDLLQSLTGPNAIAVSEDEIAASRVLSKFAKKHDKLVIKAGVVDNKVISVDEIKELAGLPNKEGMLSMLLSCLQSPISSFARATKAIADAKEAN
ncbi:MAG: 50S ribosomal protein L10 [Erysipelotrichaceae bacterium]|nr:50S ribosomal protein L10 [Erysipelotrichaceae bacterium]MBQ3383989.1 50S ribosomal protein L10 [Erysipelotrichaceae bacterium]MBR2746583.1 50S ribosomal protein L10 [Erysipelotrichaceae bacterium]